jgi:hypothetical protein
MTPEQAAIAYLGVTLLDILMTKGPDAYFRIVAAIQKVNPTLEDIEDMILKAKDPDSYLKP